MEDGKHQIEFFEIFSEDELPKLRKHLLGHLNAFFSCLEELTIRFSEFPGFDKSEWDSVSRIHKGLRSATLAALLSGGLIPPPPATDSQAESK